MFLVWNNLGFCISIRSFYTWSLFIQWVHHRQETPFHQNEKSCSRMMSGIDVSYIFRFPSCSFIIECDYWPVKCILKNPPPPFLKFLFPENVYFSRHFLFYGVRIFDIPHYLVLKFIKEILRFYLNSCFTNMDHIWQVNCVQFKEM